MTATRLGTWARRNRWGLALLPIAAVAVLAASSDRLDAYYLMANPIRASVAEPGQAITFQTQAVDADGSHDLAVELSLAGTTPTSELWGGDSIDLPDGARLVRVDLALAAPPESILLGCQMAVVDTEGRRYDYQHLPIGGGSQPVSPCVPEDTPGPRPSLGALGGGGLAPDEEPRPERWSVGPVFVVPEDAEIEAVLVWWNLPDYAELRVG